VKSDRSGRTAIAFVPWTIPNGHLSKAEPQASKGGGGELTQKSQRIKMFRSKIRIDAAFCLLALLFFAVESFSQGSTVNLKDDRLLAQNAGLDYLTVIDSLFPTYFLGRENGVGLVLRYSPTNKPEVQVNILYKASGSAEVTIFRAVDKSILLQLQDIQSRNQEISFDAAVAQIKYERYRVDLPRQAVRQIRSDFLQAIEKTLAFEAAPNRLKENEITIPYDRDGYEVWYLGKGTMKFSSEANSLGNKPTKNEAPYINWMRAVIKRAEQAKRMGS
jgi:hypothetical protein